MPQLALPLHGAYLVLILRKLAIGPSAISIRVTIIDFIRPGCMRLARLVWAAYGSRTWGWMRWISASRDGFHDGVSAFTLFVNSGP